MYSVLAIINQKILPDDNFNVEVVDLTSPNTAFDDNVGYEDAPEDEPISKQPKCKKLILIHHKIALILISMLKQHYINQ